MAVLPWLATAAGGGLPGLLSNRKGRTALKEGLFGTPERFDQKSLLSEGQQPLLQNLLASLQGEGAGGAFGDTADYYRGLLSNDSEDFNAFANPELRRFREETIPGLSEQFAGFGAGGSGLSGSGFRNAAINAGTDLSERLGAIRAQLRQQGAQGLSSLGQQGLGQYQENIFRPQQPGLVQQALPIAGKVLAAKYGGKAF